MLVYLDPEYTIWFRAALVEYNDALKRYKDKYYTK